MVNKPPKSFKLGEKTENLYLFYQCITEMLFDFSPDSYKVKSFNTHTLLFEAYKIFTFLKQDDSLQRYYNQYIPIIIEEILYNLHKDPIAKEILDKRYEKYVNILEQAMNANTNEEKITIFDTNIRNLLHLFENKIYYKKIVEKLELYICNPKQQGKIISLSNTFLCELLFLGYSKQHVYNVVNGWFKQGITTCESVKDLFKIFDFKSKEWEIITLVNKKLYGYYTSNLREMISIEHIKIENFTSDDLNSLIIKNSSYEWFKKVHMGLIHVSMVKAKVLDYDPYTAYEKLLEFLKVFNNLVTMFDNEMKLHYSSVICLNYQYNTTISVKRPMEKRLRYYGQDYSKRTSSVLKKMNMSNHMFNTFLKMLSFHGDALRQDIDDKYTLLMLWTSLESLFAGKDNQPNKSIIAKNSLIEIIQRTYIIKILKYLHHDFLDHLKQNKRELIKKYNLDNIDIFISLLFDESSECKKEVCDSLSNNPLLRSRIYQVATQNIHTADMVSKSLSLHKKKINWQIQRIYRTRNLIVHTGRQIPYIGDLVEHLHNYLDFIINYIICKVENDEAITNINDIVTEVKIDNELHKSILNSYKGTLTKDKVYEILFGASNNVINYYRDSIV